MPRALLLGIALLWCIAASSHAQWTLYKIGGRDYVPLENVANFYGLGHVTQVGNDATMELGARSLKGSLNSVEFYINRLKFNLSYPIVDYNGIPVISRMDLTKVLEPVLRPQKIKNAEKIDTVVLDAGHGGHDNGAKSVFGYEKDYTLDTVRRLRKKLEAAGLRVVQTRNSDTFIDLDARPRVANKTPGSIFVSIHYNSADWKPSASGIETYCISPLGAPPSGQDGVMTRDKMPVRGHALEPVNFTLANAVQHALTGKLGVEDRGVKRARFVVLKDAGTPAILIEGGFLTNPGDAQRIADPTWRDRYAQAIAAGIVEYKNLAEKGLKPKERKDW